MKPRTKLQSEVLELSILNKKYDILKPEQEKWAFHHCLEHKGFATKSRVICMDCGETFSTDLISRKRATCPHCDTKLKIEYTRKSTDSQWEYFAVAEVHLNYQVIRNFKLTGHYKQGRAAELYCHEILQYWINDYGKVTMVGRNHNTQGNCDSWGSDWSIRVNRRSGYYYNGQKYRIYPYKYHPSSTFRSEYTKYGINHTLDGLYFLDAIDVVPDNPYAETLLKAKQHSLLFQCRDYSNKVYSAWPSIKICMRNRYKVNDASMWFDYLDLLSFFGKDLRNAYYVCPKNLKKAHDRLVEKRRRVREREAALLKLQRIKNEQKQYIIDKGKYFGLVFSNKKIKVSVLKSVQEFLEEGDALSHCLFTNDYHKKQHSLLFKAEFKGKSVETVEVCLKSFTILQARGKHNQPSKLNGEIRELVEANMNKIRMVANGKGPRIQRQKVEHLLAS